MKLIKVSPFTLIILLSAYFLPLLRDWEQEEKSTKKFQSTEIQSLLSKGHKISIKKLDYNTAIKLPGTSDRLARELLKLKSSTFINPQDLKNELLKINGIGEKKAATYIKIIKP